MKKKSLKVIKELDLKTVKGGRADNGFGEGQFDNNPIYTPDVLTGSNPVYNK